MSLRSLHIYRQAEELSDRVYRIVDEWTEFDKRTLGSQIVRAADSVSNNIAEGYGRVAIGERLQFYLYAEGSTQETVNCLHRANGRSLMTEAELQELTRLCVSISIGIIEFAFAQMQREPSYQGPFRARIDRRRKCLVDKRARESD